MDKQYHDIVNDPSLSPELKKKIQVMYRSIKNDTLHKVGQIKELNHKVDAMAELLQFNEKLEQACLQVVDAIKFDKGLRCPVCNYDVVYNLNSEDSHQYQCGFCRYRFGVIDNTVFHNTKLPIQKWFHLIFLSVKKSPTLFNAKILNMTQKSTWGAKEKIRELSDIKQLNNKLNKLANGK